MAAVVVLAAIFCVYAAQLLAVAHALGRDAEVDESEYLHSGWLLHQGDRLYRDFFEDHSPAVIIILNWLVPNQTTRAFPIADLPTYITRARIVMGVCGVLAVGAMALLLFRMTRGPLAPLIASATLFGSGLLWYRGLTDVRVDPPSLFLFWTGTLLILGQWRSDRARPGLAALGIGLVAMAALTNPKWLFESTILGVLVLIELYRSRRPALLAIPLACVGGFLAFITSVTSLRDYYFFTFRYNMAMGAWFATRPAMVAGPPPVVRPFLYCDGPFKGWLAVIGLAAAIAVSWLPALKEHVDLRRIRILLLLALAALLEIRFIFPWPRLWTQYFLQWSFVLAALYGIVIAALVERLRERFAWLPAAVAAIAVALLWLNLPVASQETANAKLPMRSFLQRRLGPGETVWLETRQHPIGARDDSYYWFGFNDHTAFSIEWAARHPESPLPRMTEEELPICRAERGLEPKLRFVSGGIFIARLPMTTQCLQRMIASGRAELTPVSSVYELRR